MAQFTRYASTDGSAPVLDGQAGSGYNVAKKCLVTGYGAKAAAGWAEEFSGTNKGVFRPPTGNRHRYRLQDDAPNPTLAAGREMRLRAAEAFSTVDAFTGGFPTAAQLANGLFITKSQTADATARPWVVFADERTAILLVQSGDFGLGWSGTYFGEYYHIDPVPFTYNSLVAGRNTERIAATPTLGANLESFNLFSAITVVTAGHYVPRTVVDMQSAVNVSKHGNSAHSAASMVGLYPLTTSIDLGAHLAPITLTVPQVGNPEPLGRLRGVWHFLHAPGVALANFDTIVGTGLLAGKTFEIIKPGADNNSILCFETSNTLETN